MKPPGPIGTSAPALALPHDARSLTTHTPCVGHPRGTRYTPGPEPATNRIAADCRTPFTTLSAVAVTSAFTGSAQFSVRTANNALTLRA